MDKIAYLTQELKKMAATKPDFSEVLRYKADLVDRIRDIKSAANEGVAIDPRQLLSAKKDMDLLQLRYAPEFEAQAKRRGMLTGGVLGGLLGGVIGVAGPVPNVGRGLLGAGIGALGLGALGRRSLGNESKEETREARRRRENSMVRKLDEARTADNLRKAMAMGDIRAQMRIARAGAPETNITNIANSEHQGL